MLVLGHRGAKAYAPENTIPAFRKAIEQGADGIELDVHLTKDQQLVVCHNFDVKDTSNRSGLIRNMTLSELKALDFGVKFSPQYAGTQIPTLCEALEAVREMKVINIELKSDGFSYPALPKLACQLVKELCLEKKVLFSSFDHNIAIRCKEYLPDTKVGLLYEHKIKDPAQYCWDLGADAIHPHHRLVRKMHVTACRSLGIDVNVWTVNSVSETKKFLRWGCNSIITNTPDVMIQAIEEAE